MGLEDMTVNMVPTGLARDLAERQYSGRPIQIGLVGSGEMGTDIVTRAAMMDGVDVAAITRTSTRRARIDGLHCTRAPPDIAAMPRRAMTSTPPSKAGAPL